MLGFSAKTIRRDIASMPDDVRKMSLACPSDVPVMSLTEYGLKWLAEKHGIPFSGSSPDGSSGRQEEKQESENELVLSLLEQLRQRTFRLQKRTSRLLNSWSRLKLSSAFASSAGAFFASSEEVFFKRLFGIHEEKE